MTLTSYLVLAAFVAFIAWIVLRKKPDTAAPVTLTAEQAAQREADSKAAAARRRDEA